uniref:Uncharacterized protein n=1 Tax=Lepeophtheirus salmonis TaxID=72036 RepID=A0A0K2V615_LEPSM
MYEISNSITGCIPVCRNEKCGNESGREVWIIGHKEPEYHSTPDKVPSTYDCCGIHDVGSRIES